ncbi:MAG: hypothetical protein M0C28_11800 [Candidatus Moduliflexus flocculans]|nr:hypothetical protein [Candidatus Moduliflexus flocculans]
MGLADAFVIPVIAHRSEQAKLHYVFVYGADDRVLCRYDVAAAPLERFAVAIDPLADALSRQLKDDGCPSWERCLTVYTEEVRRRSVCVDYTLTSKQEAMLRQLRTLAADADAGRLPQGRCLCTNPILCAVETRHAFLRPTPLRERRRHPLPHHAIEGIAAFLAPHGSGPSGQVSLGQRTHRIQAGSKTPCRVIPM